MSSKLPNFGPIISQSHKWLSEHVMSITRLYSRLEDDLRSRLDRDIIPKEGTVYAMLLLLNSHREFLEAFVIEATLSEDTRIFPRKGPFMIISSKERY